MGPITLQAEDPRNAPGPDDALIGARPYTA
jgi:hypothetical protein